MTTAKHSKSERIDVRASGPVKQLLQVGIPVDRDRSFRSIVTGHSGRS